MNSSRAASLPSRKHWLVIFLGRFGYATLTSRIETGKWRQGLKLLQASLAQALKDGFSEVELARGKREVAALLEKAVQTAPSRDSRALAEEIIRKLNDQEVILSPAQEMAAYGPVLEKMSLAEVNAAFRQLWSRPRRLVELVGTVDPGLTAGQVEEQLREAYLANEGQARATLGAGAARALSLPGAPAHSR